MRVIRIKRIFLIFILVLSGCADAPTTCVTDADCVPASCCHPNECVLASDAPDCTDIACTEECAPGTFDCGQGGCFCSDGFCVGVLKQQTRDRGRFDEEP